MTTDFPDARGDSACTNFSVEALRASTPQQVPVEQNSAAPQLRLLKGGWRDDSALYYDTLETLTPAVPNAAKHKNVPVQPQFYSKIARDALRMLSAGDMAALVAGDAAAINKARFAMSHALDVLAAAIVANLVAHMRGIDNPSQSVIAGVVEAHLESIKKEGTVTVWPDLLETAIKSNNAVATHG